VDGVPLPEDFRSYRWGWAPQGLATRRQLRTDGLRPGRKEPVAQISWRHGRSDRVAYLHRRDEAVQVQEPTAQQSAALQAALAARKTCAGCGQVADYVLPTRFTGSRQCLDCLEDVDEYTTGRGTGAVAGTGVDEPAEDHDDGLITETNDDADYDDLI
jgi:hypothetical protein